MNLKRLITLLAEFRIRVGEGQGHFYNIRNALLMAAPITYYLGVDAWYGFPISIVVYFGFFVIGHIDVTYLHFKQTLAELGTRKYNPYFKQLEKKIK